jgi:ubiquinone/menaquinone biosynthesis C-methylase UbiE
VSSSQAGYSVTRFVDPQAEVLRLERQADVIGSAEEAALTALGLPATGRLLDLGCGPGAVAARMKARRPGLEIIGLDRDEGVLTSARARVPVLRADAAWLPFPSESFDGVHARLVLRHLPDPDAALAEARRVLRRGGRVIVADSDDGALVMHPYPEAIARALRAKHQSANRRGADPHMGRRLVDRLTAAGFSDLTVRTEVIDSGSVGRAAFAQIVLVPLASAIDSDLLDADGQAAAGAAIRSWGGDVRAFGMTTVIAVGGTKD